MASVGYLLLSTQLSFGTWHAFRMDGLGWRRLRGIQIPSELASHTDGDEAAYVA